MIRKTDRIIALPNRIYMLKPCTHSTIDLGREDEEYNLYFANFILPLLSDDEVQVRCDYGRNYGEFWRLNEFPKDVTEFPITFTVYDGFGEHLAAKTCTVELCTENQASRNFCILPIGDSMTQAQQYLEHTAQKLNGIHFKGSRCFRGGIGHEGRGGFKTEDYVSKFQDPYAPSPFLFPKGVSGKDYYGDQTFWGHVTTDWESNSYVYGGYHAIPLTDGMVYNRDGILYRRLNGVETIYNNAPEWEFSFPKYMERYAIGPIDAVSVLLGTNDILDLHYDSMEKGICRVTENFGVMIDSIRSYSKTLPILLNLPILCSADPFSFGRNFACAKTPREVRAVMLHLIHAMLEKWENSADPNLYIVPMNAVIHPTLAFAKEAYSNGKYFGERTVRIQDSVHPTRAGYAQMGDLLAATVQKIRILHEAKCAPQETI